MRPTTLIMMGIAAVFAVVAVLAGNAYLQSQEPRVVEMASQPAPAPARTIVVAAQPLKFGTTLQPSNLREIAWAGDAMPAGAFEKIADLVNGQKLPRVALQPMEINEPILRSRITGDGQRGTLSALIGDGMKAVTVRATDVTGVAGFIQPGDRVDLLLTRQEANLEAYTDVLIQNVRVLAVDQVVDQANEKPHAIRAVTVEVAIEHAQKVTLASSVGTLSLALRRSGEAETTLAGRVTGRHLANDVPDGKVDMTTTGSRQRRTMVGVTRASNKREEYDVLVAAEGTRPANQRR
jgi:pilus assembly protein CpaB